MGESMKTYVYVDGESHFIRSDACWKKMHGEEAGLNDAMFVNDLGGVTYPDRERQAIRVEMKSKFFWDTTYTHLAPTPWPNNIPPVDGAVYFTDFSGGDVELHDARVFIRKQGFDPQVIKERSQLAKRRENWLKTEGILEKPKGVDIGLTVRLLEDSYRHIFDVCYLFTSDVDYVPVIQAIQRVGQKVIVFGYKDGLGNNSDLEYIPDAFIDLSEKMRSYTFRKAGS
jgi:uncharacterized LabA/DUF88 family protein